MYDYYVCANCGWTHGDHLEQGSEERFEVRLYYYFSLADCPGYVPDYPREVSRLHNMQQEAATLHLLHQIGSFAGFQVYGD